MDGTNQTSSCCSFIETIKLISICLGILFFLVIFVLFMLRILKQFPQQILYNQQASLDNEQQRKAGLHPNAISSILSFAYNNNPTTASTNNSNDDSKSKRRESLECSVCLNFVQQGEIVRLLPACKHLFHVQCIDVWLQSNSTCPVCRADVCAEKMQEISKSTKSMVIGEASGLKEEHVELNIGVNIV